MKINLLNLITFLMLVSCSKTDNHQKEVVSEEAEHVSTQLELIEDTETELNVLSLKKLILDSDSIYLLIGESGPTKEGLYIKERLTKKDDIKSLAVFIPKDSSTTLIIYPTDTAKGELPPPPPPPRFGRPIGALKLYSGATGTKYIEFNIDSAKTFIYFKDGRSQMAFTKEGDVYLRRMYNEYKSLQQNL